MMQFHKIVHVAATCRREITVVVLRMSLLILRALTMSKVVEASKPLEMESMHKTVRCVITISPAVCMKTHDKGMYTLSVPKNLPT